MDFRFSCQKTSVLGFWCSLRFADFLFFAFVLTLVATPGGRGGVRIFGFSALFFFKWISGFCAILAFIAVCGFSVSLHLL